RGLIWHIPPKAPCTGRFADAASIGRVPAEDLLGPAPESDPGFEPSGTGTPATVDSGRRATLSIALACGLGSMSFNFWYPFMPLYLLSVGATSQANALFWIAVATSIQGVTRLLTGPIWGVLSDRLGRKLML